MYLRLYEQNYHFYAKTNYHRNTSPVDTKLRGLHKIFGLRDDVLLSLLMTRGKHVELAKEILDDHGDTEVDWKSMTWPDILDEGYYGSNLIDREARDRLRDEVDQWTGDYRLWVAWKRATDAKRPYMDTPREYSFYPPIDE